MRIHSFLSLLIICLTMLSEPLVAQRNIVSADGTLRDKFGKKLGNIMFSTITLKFGRIKNNAVKSDTIRFFNAGERPVTFLIGKSPAHLVCNLHSASVASKAESWMVVTFDARKKGDYGFVFDRFELMTNDSLQPKKMISVTATIEESFPSMNGDDSAKAPKARISETIFNYGKIKQGTKVSHEFVIHNDGQKNLMIHKAKSNSDCIQSSFTKTMVASGDSCTVKVDFDSAGKDGTDSRKVDVYVNDFLKPNITLELKGEVTK